LLETESADVRVKKLVERRALLADPVATAGAAQFRFEEEGELVEATKTVLFVEASILRQ